MKVILIIMSAYNMFLTSLNQWKVLLCIKRKKGALTVDQQERSHLSLYIYLMLNLYLPQAKKAKEQKVQRNTEIFLKVNFIHFI